VRAHLLRACRILNVGFEEELRRAAKQLEGARERRDHLIVKASEAGMSRRKVAAVTGLTGGRVQQIITSSRERKP
jgi:hypothetical protein